jgi:putative transcriptional regulator
MSSVRQARWIRRGMVKAARITVFRPKYVKAARARLGRLKSEFALEIRVSVATSQSCEQGRRTPDGPALALLRVAAGNPKPVAEALHVKRRGTAQFA